MTDDHSQRLPSKQAILDYLQDGDDDPSRRDIARAFGIKGAARADLRALLKEMEADGLIERAGAKRSRAAGRIPPVMPVDVIEVDDDGDLSCAPAVWRGTAAPPKIVLTRKDAAKARHAPGVGDRLLVRLQETSTNKYRASLIKAIGKATPRILGLFRKTRFGGIIEPVDKRARRKVTVDAHDAMGAEDGDLVWVELIERRGSLSKRARVREIAGGMDDDASFSLIALASHDIPTDMPDEAIREAEAAELPSLDGRTDLRETPLLTIDPADARDHDDAVWAAPDDDPANKGGHIVIVAIADVSWFVRPGSRLDKEALRRGNSVYLPDRVVPMLPERLSNDLCSLREGEDRPCLAVRMRIAKDGQKLDHHFMRATMRSAAKLSYEEAQRRIDGPAPEKDDIIGETLRHLKDAFDARWTEREKRAPLDLDLPERKLIFGEAGGVSDVRKLERLDAHRLIEEFMILANVAAAETLERAKTAQIYRAHDAPDPERLDAARDQLEALGYSLIKGGSIRPRHFNQLLKLAGERGQRELVSELILRSQRQAVYDTENVGHFGLNLARYSHFTSPIRRYADLTIHRALVRALRLGPGGQTEDEAGHLPKVAEGISDLERRAMAAERDARDRFLADYLRERIGETFEARIRGVTRFGVFVSLDETGADGFVPMRALGFERFRFEESLGAVIGETTGRGYRLGQAVEVRLEEAAPLTGGLRFDMLSEPVAVEGARKRGAASRSANREHANKKRAARKRSRRKQSDTSEHGSRGSKSGAGKKRGHPKPSGL
ncbi:MAG: ribonuclease R [Pseudomonadota bacterium]